MLDLFHAILQRAEAEPPLFFANETETRQNGVVNRLAAVGILSPASPARSAECPGCREHVRPTQSITDAASKVRIFVTCPECGPSTISPDRLRRWSVEFDPLLDAAFSDTGLSGRRDEIVQRRLWRLGRAEWAGKRCSVFFGRQFHKQDVPRLLRDAHVPASAVVFSLLTVPHGMTNGSSYPVVIPLAKAVYWEKGGIRFDHAYVQDQLAGSSTHFPTTIKKPPPKRASRSANIDKLTKEMIAHIRSARDYAISTRDARGIPELLPRPSQRQLAKRLEISESDVSRCLKDPTARELRLLWDLAADVDRILSFRR